MKTRIILGMTVLLLALVSQGAMAQCSITGTITASPNPDTMGPQWMYSMVVVWDTGTQYALSHFNLLLDSSGGTCACQDFMDALSWGDPVGYSDGTPAGCTVDYQGFLECSGDPSIPGVDGFLLKFEPIEDDCEPGPIGTGTFVFYSNLPPVPIDEEILSVVDKYAQEYCFGHLAGDFPAMACDPVGNQESTWGSLKGMFR